MLSGIKKERKIYYNDSFGNGEYSRSNGFIESKNGEKEIICSCVIRKTVVNFNNPLNY